VEVAGDPVAFGLDGRVAPLEQAGTKVPVFAQVAKAIITSIEGGPERKKL